jgi:hypothetical protein
MVSLLPSEPERILRGMRNDAPLWDALCLAISAQYPLLSPFSLFPLLSSFPWIPLSALVRDESSLGRGVPSAWRIGTKWMYGTTSTWQ